MCWEVERVTYPHAKKHYQCQACEWLVNIPIEEIELSDDERLCLDAAKADHWKILPGQKYIKIRGKFDGEWQTFRARIDVNEICKRHGIYEC